MKIHAPGNTDSVSCHIRTQQQRQESWASNTNKKNVAVLFVSFFILFIHYHSNLDLHVSLNGSLWLMFFPLEWPWALPPHHCATVGCLALLFNLLFLDFLPRLNDWNKKDNSTRVICLLLPHLSIFYLVLERLTHFLLLLYNQVNLSWPVLITLDLHLNWRSNVPIKCYQLQLECHQFNTVISGQQMEGILEMYLSLLLKLGSSSCRPRRPKSQLNS